MDFFIFSLIKKMFTLINKFGIKITKKIFNDKISTLTQ